MKTGSCFRCEQKGHLANDCPKKQTTIRKTNAKETGWTKVAKKQKPPHKSEEKAPPAYDSILEQINKCSIEDRQKILEVFSQDEDSNREDF